MASPPASRPRTGRRESVSAATGNTNRVRKNSNAGTQGTVRPRANTTGHVDGASLNLINTGASPPSVTAPSSHETRHSSIGSVSAFPNFDYRGFSVNHPHLYTQFPKIETSGLPIDLSGGGYRTAPLYGSFDLGLGDMYMSGHGSTVNPAQLHFPDSPNFFANDGMPPSPFSHATMPDVDPALEDDYQNYDWINCFDPMLVLGSNNECVIDGSSPSTGSQSGISEAILDGSNNNNNNNNNNDNDSQHVSAPTSSASGWPNSISGHQAIHQIQPYAMDLSTPTYNDPGALT